MSNPFKALKKGVKSLVKGVKNVFRSVVKGVKKLFSSPLGKAILIGAALFFGIPAAAGALGIGASTGAGATAWWSSTFGLGGGAATSTAAATMAGPGIQTAAAGGLLGPTTGAMANLAGTGSAIVPTTGAAGAFGAAAPAGLLAKAGAGIATAGKGVVNAGKGLLASDTAKGALVTTLGQGIAGHYTQKAEEEKEQRGWDREDQQWARGGAWGLRNDGTRVQDPLGTRFQGPVNPGAAEDEEAERLLANMTPWERQQLALLAGRVN